MEVGSAVGEIIGKRLLAGTLGTLAGPTFQFRRIFAMALGRHPAGPIYLLWAFRRDCVRGANPAARARA